MIHGMEFQAVYDTRDKVKKILRNRDIKFTELRPKESFLYKMLEKEVHKRDGTVQFGYGLCRWKVSMGYKRKTCNNQKIFENKVWRKLQRICTV